LLDGVAGSKHIFSLQLELLALIYQKGVVQSLGSSDAVLGFLAQHPHHDVSAGLIQTQKVLVEEVDLALAILFDDFLHFFPLEQGLLE